MGGGGGWGVVGLGALLAGLTACAGAGQEARGEARQERGQEPGETGAAIDTYVDPQLGFQIRRPTGNAWQFSAAVGAPEGIAVPLVLVHQETGAQVVVQVAPTIASPQEFAARLAVGLSTKPGFTTSEPVATGDGGTIFQFALGDLVFGKVRISEASGGRTFVLLATWPAAAPSRVLEDVDLILGSLRTSELRTAQVAQ